MNTATSSKAVAGRIASVGGRLSVTVVAEPEALPTWARSLVTAIGESRYEARHGAGTGVGFYRVVPDRSWDPSEGDEVEITAITRQVGSGPDKVFFVAGRVTRSGAERASAHEEIKKAGEAEESARLDLANTLRYARTGQAIRDALTDLPAAATALLIRGSQWGRALRADAIVGAYITDDSVKAINAVGQIMLASSKPTLSFRALPPEWKK